MHAHLEQDEVVERRPIIDDRRVDPTLARQLSSGASILLLGRNSGQTGKAARRLAINDLVQAARDLAKTRGIYVEHCLPAKSELNEALRTTQDKVESVADGRKFTNRFVELHLEGLIVLLSIGSGRKHSDDTLDQPAARRVAEVVRANRIGVLYAKRIDRVCRSDWGVGPLMLSMKASGSRHGYVPWLGDDRLWMQPGGIQDAIIFLTMAAAGQEADLIPKKTRDAMVDYTVTSLEGGRATYSIGIPPPPGFAVARLRNSKGAPAQPELFLDTPDCHPKEFEVLHGMPDVWVERPDPNNPGGTIRFSRVDQVQNIRWALANLGRPGMTIRRVGIELSRRKFSTEGLRRQSGRDKWFELPDRPLADHSAAYGFVRGVLDHLDVYETGEWIVDLGIEGFDKLTFKNMLPTDGPWAKPSDFARIRAYQQHYREQHQAREQLTFSRFPVTVNGEQCHLRPVKDPDDRTADRYAFTLTGGRDAGLSPAGTAGALLPARTLAYWLARALNKAPELTLSHFIEPVQENPHLAEVEVQLRRERLTLAGTEAELAAAHEALLERDASGQRIVTGTVLASLNETMNRAQEKIDGLMASISKLEAELGRLTRRTSSLRGLPLEEHLAFVDSLRDTRDDRLREIWKDALVDLNVEVTRFRELDARGNRISLKGTLVLRDDEAMFALPISGTVITGQAAQIPDRIAACIDYMRQGIPAAQTLRSMLPIYRSPIAKALGYTSDSVVCGSMLDPRVLRIAMAVLHPPLDNELRYEEYRESTDCPRLAGPPVPVADLEGVAEELGEPLALVRRIRELHDPERIRRSRWVQRSPKRFVQAISLLAEHGSLHAAVAWLEKDGSSRAPADTISIHSLLRYVPSKHPHLYERFGGKDYRLRRCANCGGRNYVNISLIEVDGPVCVACRTDTSGVVWGPEYDPFISCPDVVSQMAPSLAARVTLPPEDLTRAVPALAVVRRFEALQAWRAGRPTPEQTTHLVDPSATVLNADGRRRGRKDVAELTDEERDAFLAAYRDHTTSVIEVCKRFNLRRSDLDAYLAALHEPRRRKVNRNARANYNISHFDANDEATEDIA